MADNELLPCPFCGGAPRWLNDLGLSCYLQCTGCWVDNNRELQTKELAAERWNRRAPKAEGLAAPAVRREPEGRTSQINQILAIAELREASHPHPEVTPEMVKAAIPILQASPREDLVWRLPAIYRAMKAKEPL